MIVLILRMNARMQTADAHFFRSIDLQREFVLQAESRKFCL